MDYRPPRCSVHGVSQARILKCVASFLLQGIFLAQGWNPCLLHCRQILLPLSHLGSPIHSIVILNGRHYYLHFTDEETEAQWGEFLAPIARTSVKCQSGRFHKKNINLSTITVYPKLGPNKRKGDLDSLCRCLQQAEVHNPPWWGSWFLSPPHTLRLFSSSWTKVDLAGMKTGLWRHTPGTELSLNLFLTSYSDAR